MHAATADDKGREIERTKRNRELEMEENEPEGRQEKDWKERKWNGYKGQAPKNRGISTCQQRRHSNFCLPSFHSSFPSFIHQSVILMQIRVHQLRDNITRQTQGKETHNKADEQTNKSNRKTGRETVLEEKQDDGAQEDHEQNRKDEKQSMERKIGRRRRKENEKDWRKEKTTNLMHCRTAKKEMPAMSVRTRRRTKPKREKTESISKHVFKSFFGPRHPQIANRNNLHKRKRKAGFRTTTTREQSEKDWHFHDESQAGVWFHEEFAWFQ